MLIISLVSYSIVYLADHIYSVDSITHLVFIITISTLSIVILSYLILIEQYEKNLIGKTLNKIIKRQ